VVNKFVQKEKAYTQKCLNCNGNQYSELYAVKIRFGSHGYDLSNTFQWPKERIPFGTGYLHFIDPICNEVWRTSLEKSGLSELLFEVRKQ